MNDDLFSNLIEKLKNENLITYFDTSSTVPPVESAEITKLLMEPVRIFVWNNNLCYKNESGDTVCCPELDSSVSDAGYWLSDKIPPPPFDISQGGNVRKSEEAEACYICCIICSILNDDVLTKEIELVQKGYNFEKMINVDEDISFRNCLAQFLDLQSVIINVIVSASKYAISSQKKNTEEYMRDGLTTIERDALRDLSLEIKQINFEYSTTILSPGSVKKLSKIEILENIQKRDSIIRTKINGSQFGDLYRTLNLSTEYISPILKKKISNFVATEIDKMYNEDPSIVERYGDRSTITSKARRRCYNIARASVRKENVLRYLENREGYLMPRKA